MNCFWAMKNRIRIGITASRLPAMIRLYWDHHSSWNRASPTVRGRARSVEVIERPEHDDHGRIIAALGIVKDVTDRNKAEEELRLAATVFDNTDEGIIITDAKRKQLTEERQQRDAEREERRKEQEAKLAEKSEGETKKPEPKPNSAKARLKNLRNKKTEPEKPKPVTKPEESSDVQPQAAE